MPKTSQPQSQTLSQHQPLQSLAKEQWPTVLSDGGAMERTPSEFACFSFYCCQMKHGLLLFGVYAGVILLFDTLCFV